MLSLIQRSLSPPSGQEEISYKLMLSLFKLHQYRISYNSLAHYVKKVSK